MIPIIPNCFPVSTYLFLYDWLDILCRNKISTCTGRSEVYQNKEWDKNDRNEKSYTSR
jgi:hypothetical protein